MEDKSKEPVAPAAKTADNKPKTEFREPGWKSMQSTSAFRVVNFELFVKPVSNIYVIHAHFVYTWQCEKW